MKLLNFEQKDRKEIKELTADFPQTQNYFLLCRASEVPSIQKVIHLEESTVRECVNLDESVRFEGLDGYDFISMVYLEEYDQKLLIREINIYVFKNGIILVMPDESDGLLQQAEDTIIKQIKDLTGQGESLNIGLYIIFHTLLMDSSNLLEKIEDEMEQLQEVIMLHVEQVDFMQINHYRQLTYTIRKQMRALSYLGAQLLVNQNNLIAHHYLRYFHNVDERLQKQYDLSVSLYELSNQLQVSYRQPYGSKDNRCGQ